ncbi:YheC/YheD family protein [Ferdinandcohnia quinoae]|uniref:YheC/YheD family protein n=1 Tax=Fredinandcohnia quinoae TaxID=2918902 RepID=A0AAW5E2H4_9BACI|nr:YheC/YheD family protein [Fredinandcohnia sp. SECRCQ15]MCH1627090.1 YheC/YheD family protein [Fredinandcohnia sp. SECRCQ15]
MITIYYDTQTKNWFHRDSLTTYTFGKKQQTIDYFGSNHTHLLPFHLANNEKKVGPLVAILTGDSTNENAFLGNIRNLQRLLTSLQTKGALGVVITPSSINKDYMDGFVFYTPLKSWIKLKIPIPDIVYNRIPYRQIEKTDDYIETIQYLKDNDVPYFNPSFFSKWTTYEVLIKNEFLSTFLPYTSLFSGRDHLLEMLSNYQNIYIKSSTGHKGIGVYQLKVDKYAFSIQSSKINQTFQTFDQFWKEFESVFSNDKFILQEGISSDTFNSKRYDLRLLCHFQIDSYVISGIGVRVAGDQEVTTHVPNGGKIIAFNEIKNRININLLKMIVDEIGKTLSIETEEFIGEFSVDIGRTEADTYFIYEVNSKPMVFDEPDIKDQGLENLTKLLIMKAYTT